uniref:Uncharacterized protein n=1 Tax=Caenorhabditis japonica TaxID=281687 RepID=A0A8R1ET56_CAEJA
MEQKRPVSQMHTCLVFLTFLWLTSPIQSLLSLPYVSQIPRITEEDNYPYTSFLDASREKNWNENMSIG